jgi:hypothetical protein
MTTSMTGARKGAIGILTGGGDVPGLNPAIRAVTIRALRAGYRVIGFRRGWAGLVEMVRDPQADNRDNFQYLDENLVNSVGRTGGTYLHTSRTRPSKVKRSAVPAHLQSTYTDEALGGASSPAVHLHRRPQRPHARGAGEPGVAGGRVPHPHRRR